MLIAVQLKIQVFWDLTLCLWARVILEFSKDSDIFIFVVDNSGRIFLRLLIIEQR